MGLIVIRPAIGDVVAIGANGKYYYALLLSRIQVFGAPLVFAFHQTSAQPLSVEQIVSPEAPGFHEFVDFIWAKRENRIFRPASKVDVKPFQKVRRFKNTFTTRGKANSWLIYDESFNELRRTKRLSAEERDYPLFHRIDDVLVCGLVDQQWIPSKDPRI